MTFSLTASKFFKEQILLLDEKSKRIISEKLQLIKENPYHFKRIHSNRFNKVFRVRLNIMGKESRLVYVVVEQNIIIACLLERKNNYNDLEKYLSLL